MQGERFWLEYLMKRSLRDLFLSVVFDLIIVVLRKFTSVIDGAIFPVSGVELDVRRDVYDFRVSAFKIFFI